MTPAFLGGFRSGTTLLINLLGLDPEIAPWFETKELCEALRWLKVLRKPACAAAEGERIQPRAPAGFTPAAVSARMAWHVRRTLAQMRGEVADGKPPHERYPLGGDCILYPLAEAEDALARWRAEVEADAAPPAVAAASAALIARLGALQTSRAGKPLWVNKTPEIPRFGEELRACLGPCRVVLVIRNGWEVVRSAHALGWGSVETLAGWWRGLIEESRAAARPGEYLEVRYEDVVHDPPASLDRVLGFLRLPPRGGELLRRYRRQMGYSLIPPRRVDGKGRALFDRIAGDLMNSLGYD